MRKRLSFANVASALALFVALTTGIAFALEINSVRSKHIAPDAAKGKDVEESSLGAVPSLEYESEPHGITADQILDLSGSGMVLGRIDDAPAVDPLFGAPLGSSLANVSES